MDTAARWRILVLSLLVIAGAVYLFTRNDPRLQPGMTSAPCTSDGESVTGCGIDDWAGLCRYRAENALLLEQQATPDVVMIGDSITRAWPIEDDGIVGRGIDRQTSAQMLVRFRQDVVRLRPRIVHILAGTNDIAGNTGPISPDIYLANIASMADLARARGIVVVLGTVPPADHFRPVSEATPGPWVQRLNDLLKQYAESEGIVLADYHSALAAPDGGPIGEYYHDPIHPGKAGYAVMQPVLERALAEARTRISGLK
ncbi:MAG: hypothetical protein H6917_12890 [Novosphingobium sp.]|nr:GDSL family lipase [Novosphingobium sp.]MCP5403266.1 hypothetical protein [Novosphingobium sp.]